MTRPQRILIVADDGQAELMRAALEKRPYTVQSQSDYESAYRQLLESEFGLVVLDLDQASAGVEFIKRVRAEPKLRSTQMLVLAEWGTGGASLALAQGVNAYEPKPLDTSRLLASVERLLDDRIVVATGSTGPE